MARAYSTPKVFRHAFFSGGADIEMGGWGCLPDSFKAPIHRAAPFHAPPAGLFPMWIVGISPSGQVADQWSR